MKPHIGSQTVDCKLSLYCVKVSLGRYVRSSSRQLGLFGEREGTKLLSVRDGVRHVLSPYESTSFVLSSDVFHQIIQAAAP